MNWRFTLNFFTSLVVAGSLLIVFNFSTAAQTLSTFTGNIDGTEPESFEVDDSTCTVIENLFHYYETFPANVTASGNYDYTDLSIFYDLDMQLTIYTDSYDPTNVLTNCVTRFDDSGTVTLMEGQQYIFVVQPLFDASFNTGDWEFEMDGPGQVIEAVISPPEEGPEEGHNEEVYNHPNTYTGFDGLGSTGFQLADGSQAFYDQSTGIITVNFGSGGTAQYGFPARITDNKDGTLNVFDATGTPVLDRVIITGRNLQPGSAVPAAPPPAAADTSASTDGMRSVSGCQITTGNPLNLRAEPTVNSDSLTIVPFQTMLGVIQVSEPTGDPNGPWYKVEYNGQQGWVSGDFVQTSGTC